MRSFERIHHLKPANEIRWRAFLCLIWIFGSEDKWPSRRVVSAEIVGSIPIGAAKFFSFFVFGNVTQLRREPVF